MEHLELADLSSRQSNLLSEKNITDANKDSFINRTALSPSRYSGIYDSLLKYTEGIPIVVDYFKRNISYIEKRSAEVTFSLERSDVEYSFTHIHHMEMKLKDQLDIQYDPETTETTIEGSGLIYPGIEPNIGDLFLFELPDNLIGVFVINNVIRLSIQQGSHNEIVFHLLQFLDTDIQDKINANIVEHLYFSKQKYLSNDVTLLKDVSYNHLKALSDYKKKILKLYMSRTYNESLMSISYLDDTTCIYDPLVVEFLNYSISVKDKNRNIDQLVGNLSDRNFNTSLWQGIISKNIFDIRDKNGITIKGSFDIWDAGISSITNSVITISTNRVELSEVETDGFFLLDNSEILPYVFSEKFYELFDLSDEELNDDDFIDNNFVNLDEFELFLVRFMVNGTLDIDDFITRFLSKYPFSAMTHKEFFYTLPIYLYIINFGIYDIS